VEESDLYGKGGVSVRHSGQEQTAGFVEMVMNGQVP